ncbi:helix-turn-helix domain-containing protein [Alteromonas sp. a30]|uniref:helix-turn-helix domain-containing protein n=1 Tax=Alteromonas sp. a30 TaxID=2730917 RepID=UPI002282C264|nr:helix-turn-helix domain-containing protein [Alteromonas sp. a30]MCY7294188.1 hypothetical protein [Alteromonas sp. a30]
MDFDIVAIFKRMYRACGVENDNQLSKFFNVKPSTIQGWKVAKTPPLKACYEIYQRTGVTVEWLVDGTEPKTEKVADIQFGSRARAINMDEDAFARAFQEEVLSGIRLDFFSANEMTTMANIERLGRHLFRELNNEPLIQKKVDKEVECA